MGNINKSFFSKFHLQHNYLSKEKTYFIKDPVLGTINFNKKNLWIYELINTPEFQRLNKILQLSLSYHNFPSATHTRLAHSLGAYEVCNRFIKELLDSNNLSNDYKTQIQINVALASALLHDLGHGPHSHAFEVYFPNYNHEVVGAYLIYNSPNINKILIKKAIEDNLSEDYYLIKITDIIQKKNKDPELVWVQDLISSQIDVDRLDYLVRDAHFSGMNYGKLDFNLLSKWCVILDNQKIKHLPKNLQKKYLNKIAYLEKAQYAISHFLEFRFYMYAQLYLNIYSVGYEAIIKLMINRVKELYKNKNYEFDPIIISFLNFNIKNFDLKKFLDLNDEFFNLLINSFIHNNDLILSSLLNLYLGNIELSQHTIFDIANQEWTKMKAKIKNLKNKNLVVYDYFAIKKNKIKIYNKLNPILIYDNFNKNIIEYTDFVKETGIGFQKMEITQPKNWKTIVIIKKELLKAINYKDI